MKYYNYQDTGKTLTNLPANILLIVEKDSDTIYYVKSGALTQLYKYILSTDTESQVDIDPSNSSGDVKSRDRDIQALWYDGTYIWGVDCDNDGVDDTFDVWKLQVSDDTCTEILTHTSDTNFMVYVGDIFKIGSDMFIIVSEKISNTLYVVVYDVTTVLTEKDKFDSGENYPPAYFKGIVTGTKYYTLVSYGTPTLRFVIYDNSIPSVAWGTGATAGYDFPDDHSQRGVAYDGSNFMYVICEKQTDQLDYLLVYSISGDSWTISGKYNVAIMLDRNTASGVKEKAFHLTELKVYQLHPNISHQLYLIAILNASGTIVIITDNFLIVNDSGTYEVWEYVDMSHLLVKVEFVHEIQKASYGTLGVHRDEITIEKGMFMQILGTFATANLPRVYKGTYNFKDDADGSAPSGWTEADTGTTTSRVIASLGGHKKIVHFNDDDAAGRCYIWRTFTQSTDQSIEFWIRTSDSTKLFYIWFYEGATQIVYLAISAGQLKHFDGGWTNVVAIANDTWYHVRLDLDDTANTLDCYVDGVVTAGLGYLNNSATSVDRIWLFGEAADTGYDVYFDAMGLSSDVNYDVGDNLVVEGGETDQVIFEGIVVDFDGERLQKVWLESPAKKELDRKPRGDFSGRSDEIMTSLVSTYCKYITIGTLSSGTAMGTITYAGDKTLQTIFNELALFEKLIWKLDPQGRLYFNDGTVDTLVDLSKTDKIWMVKTGEVREPYNYFYLKGAIVNGVQLVKELEEADDLASQQLHGYNPFEKTFASFNTQTILDQLTSNAKAKLKETPLVVEHWHYDADLGMLAIMETVTLVYDTTNVNVASDQFLINRVLFKAEQNAGGYTIADKLV